jgi:IS30 family transposase
MSARKFTPEAQAKIPKWLAQGLSNAEIAEAIGVTVSSLLKLCSTHGISLSRQSYNPDNSQHSLRVMLSERAYRVLRQEAERMAVRNDELAELILERVVRDNLFNALELSE